MKKWIAVALVLVMAFSFAACGGRKTETAAPGMSSSGKTAENNDSVSAPEPNKTPESEIVGVWKLTRGKVMGIEMKASDLNLNMSITFKEDGSASMDNNGKTINGISWELIDGKIVRLSAYGAALYDLDYDGKVLTLYEDQHGADLILEKQ